MNQQYFDRCLTGFEPVGAGAERQLQTHAAQPIAPSPNAGESVTRGNGGGPMLTVNKFIRRQNQQPGMAKGLQRKGFVKFDLFEMRQRSLGAAFGTVAYDGQVWNIHAPAELLASPEARYAFFWPGGTRRRHLFPR